MKLEWTRSARADREAIFDYIEADNPRAAAVLDKRFEGAADRLLRSPKLGRPGRVEGTREFVVHRHYILIYELSAETVHILRILHTSRIWPTE